jgi:hypothetical protein
LTFCREGETGQVKRRKEEGKSQVLFASLRLLVRQLVRRSALAKAEAWAAAEALKPHALRVCLGLPAVESRHIAANIAKYRSIPLKMLAGTDPIRLALAAR